MRSFIRVAEIWVPSSSGRYVELGDNLYGDLGELRQISRATHFEYGEGLPGAAWALRHPIVLKDLANSYFKRADAALASGLTCAVALPIFDGDALAAVVVFMCGDDAEHVGAIELWTNERGGDEMTLVDGYYGTAETFEWSSRHAIFYPGMGLPGQVWQGETPVVMEDLGRSRRFLRWETAQRVGISKGIGIPCGRDGDQHWVMTFLSALGTPLARRFEVWAPDAPQAVLTFKAGICEDDAELADSLASCEIGKGEGILGRVWQSRRPTISIELAGEPQLGRSAATAETYSSMLALPVMRGGTLNSIVAWYL